MTTARPISLDLIRQAVMCGEFSRAQLLWSDCVTALAAELSNGGLSEARLAEVGELVAWSRSVVLSERAHLLRRLNCLHVAGEYDPRVPACAGRLVETSL